MTKEDFVIIDGSVEYKHSKPIAEYETIAPLVRLNFTIAEGSDPEAVAYKVMCMAKGIVETSITDKVEVKGHSVEKAVRPKKIEPVKDTVSVVEGIEGNLTLKGDIQPLAQKVSAHLRKVSGNINKLREVIKKSGGTSLLTIPEDKWPVFIEKAKELLP